MLTISKNKFSLPSQELTINLYMKVEQSLKIIKH